MLLNPQQQKAVEAPADRNILVLAGAGTGKTRVLTNRIAHLIRHGHTNSSSILALTFTNKAAKSMRSRIKEANKHEEMDFPYMGTFHAVGLRLLKRHGEQMGLPPNFSIITKRDQEQIIKDILLKITLEDLKPKLLAMLLDRWKNLGLRPEQLDESIVSPMTSLEQAQTFYRAYQERLSSIDSVDFGDLLLMPLTMMLKNREIYEQYRTLFTHIFVDEYQDTNTVQYLLLRLLAHKGNAICCVGDDDQSIYSWRGACLENILRFEKDFSNPLVILLEQNYRSTHHILGCASRLIARNQQRMDKSLWCDHQEGEAVTLFQAFDHIEEARGIIHAIQRFMEENSYTLDNVAILVRTAAQMQPIEEQLLMNNIPYIVVGSVRFFDRAEIRDAHAYLRFLLNPRDANALRRIINKPRRGIGKKSVEHLLQSAESMPENTLLDGLLAPPSHLRPATRRAMMLLGERFRQWKVASEQKPPAEVLSMILEDSGMLPSLREEKTDESRHHMECLASLRESLYRVTHLEEYMEQASLLENHEHKSGEGGLSLMTLHAAKGLEFDLVFLAGWEEEILPHIRSLKEGEASIEEERRLAYVGLTRAKKKAIISFTKRRQQYGHWVNRKPSRFIHDLPAKHIAGNVSNIQGLSTVNNANIR